MKETAVLQALLCTHSAVTSFSDGYSGYRANYLFERLSLGPISLRDGHTQNRIAWATACWVPGDFGAGAG